MVNLTIPAIAAACLVFVLVSWNMLLPFTSAKNADFLNYAKYTMENWFGDNPQLQQISDAPIVKSVKASMIDQFVTDEKNNFNIGPRILAERYPGPSNVTLTFYVEYNDQQMMPKLIETLHSHNVKKAVFFIEDQYALDHPFMIRALKDNGYKVSNWANLSDYDHSYSPTVFRGTVLSDKDLLSHSLRDSNAAAFLETAVHYSSTSTIAFTPKIMYHELILDQILEDSDNNTLILTDTNEAVSSPNIFSAAAPNSIGSGGNNSSADLSNATSILGTSAYSSSSASSANASNVVIVENTEPFYISTGNWTIEKLHHLYPSVVTSIPEKGKNAYLLLNSLTMSNPTDLDVTGVQLYLRSSTDKDPNPVVLLIRGKAIFNNSLITSWNSKNKRPDIDSFHPRPFVIVKNGGIINVYNSEISYLGYSLGGVEDTRYARAAISYYDTSNFEIKDSKIAFNYYGFYSDHANNYRIVGNEIFGNTRYGLDPHTGSSNFLVDSNYIHDNGNQGVICSLHCDNVTITNNLIEYNTEGIGIHWLTNSSLVKDNIVRYNQKYGIFIQKHSFNNTVEDNVVIGNNKGIGLLDDSNNNLIQSNIVANNIQADVHTDPDSQSNIVKNIVNQIQDVNGLNSRINWFHNVLGKSWGVDK